ncbi:MAG TPA: DNA-binding response regulator, partial [Cyanobacteria bacterium UBA11369]|nr:DNA-binding response regulator [Cyanobacteria bacterium UBA11369]
HADFTLVGSVGTQPTAIVQQIETSAPDVLLLDWDRVEDEAISEQLFALGMDVEDLPAIAILTDSLTSTSQALRLGVRAILPRFATKSEIIAAVAAAATGLFVLHPDAVETLQTTLPSTARTLPASPLQALTPREIEVLGMLAEGMGNKTIARQLGISEHTVKFHVASILSKLNASSRTEAVTLGARLGLIML